METSLVLIRLYFSLAMFFGIFIAYLLPFKLVQRRSKPRKDVSEGDSNFSDSSGESGTITHFNPKVLSYCNCIAAGIFVSICFLGLFPVVREEFNLYFKEVQLKNVEYPLAEFTILMGFFIVMFLEEFLLRCTTKHSPPTLHLDENVNEQSYRLLEEPTGDNQILKEGNSAICVDSSEKSVSDASLTIHHQHSHQQDNHGHGHSHSHISTINANGVLFSVLVFATSIHSVFEGLALGLLSDAPKAMHLFIGIIAHEVLVAFALGINAIKLNRTFSKNIQFAVVFAATVPLGIILGVLMGQLDGALGKLTSAVFQGFAAGTFLNVAFCELIPSELTDGPKYIKMLLILIGALSMAILSLFHGSHH